MNSIKIYPIAVKDKNDEVKANQIEKSMPKIYFKEEN